MRLTLARVSALNISASSLTFRAGLGPADPSAGTTAVRTPSKAAGASHPRMLRNMSALPRKRFRRCAVNPWTLLYYYHGERPEGTGRGLAWSLSVTRGGGGWLLPHPPTPSPKEGEGEPDTNAREARSRPLALAPPLPPWERG